MGAQERRAALAAGGAPRADLLGVLLDARDEAGQPMTDEELWEVRRLPEGTKMKERGWQRGKLAALQTHPQGRVTQMTAACAVWAHHCL